MLRGTVALAAQADYVDHGKSDFAVWRPSTGTWYIREASGQTLAQQWGEPTDIAVNKPVGQ